MYYISICDKYNVFEDVKNYININYITNPFFINTINYQNTYFDTLCNNLPNYLSNDLSNDLSNHLPNDLPNNNECYIAIDI